MRHSTRLLVPAMVFIVATPARSQRTDSAASARQIDSVYARMTQAYRRNDARAAAAVYAEAASYLAPGGRLLRGRDAITREMTKILGPVPSKEPTGRPINFEILSRSIAGDIAYDVGRYAIGGDKPAGSFVAVLRRGVDGRWLFWADASNPIMAPSGGSDMMPLSAAPAVSGSSGKADAANANEVAGTYNAVAPAPFAGREVTVVAMGNQLVLRGLSDKPVPLPANGRDEYKLDDPNGPPGLVMRFHRSGGKIVAATIGGSSPAGPSFFFVR